MKILFGVLCWVMAFSVSAQKMIAEKSVITFFSDAVFEDITATNTKATCILQKFTGDIAVLIPVDQFQFPNKLMQVHYNEKYMESEKYPKATFAGKLEGFDPDSRVMQQVVATGTLTMHGVTHTVKIAGTITRTETGAVINAVFPIKLADYNIVIPKIMWQKIAEVVEVRVNVTLKNQS